EHEGAIFVKRFRRERSPAGIPSSQLSRRPFREIGNAVLRQNPLVNMIVTGEHCLYPVFLKQRFQDISQFFGRPMRGGRRVEWMVEKSDLPLIVGILQLLGKPFQLLGVHVVAVQREKSDMALLE